jgi:large subunit ribosomal protein L18
MKISNVQKRKKALREKRKARVRSRLFGVEVKPRLSVYRSLAHIYAQIVDDSKSATLIAASDSEIKDKKLTKKEAAEAVGKLLAEKSLQKGISEVVFDRGGFKYHGRISALAEAARKGGLKF